PHSPLCLSFTFSSPPPLPARPRRRLSSSSCSPPASAAADAPAPSPGPPLPLSTVRRSCRRPVWPAVAPSRRPTLPPPHCRQRNKGKGWRKGAANAGRRGSQCLRPNLWRVGRPQRLTRPPEEQRRVRAREMPALPSVPDPAQMLLERAAVRAYPPGPAVMVLGSAHGGHLCVVVESAPIPFSSLSYLKINGQYSSIKDQSNPSCPKFLSVLPATAPRCVRVSQTRSSSVNYKKPRGLDDAPGKIQPPQGLWSMVEEEASVSILMLHVWIFPCIGAPRNRRGVSANSDWMNLYRPPCAVRCA
ncbi:unnamed protein product, partial [Urochloa humidicola]